MKKKAFISSLLGLAISAVALYFSLRQAPLGELAAYVTRINYYWMPLAVLITLLAFLVRAERWRLILAPNYRLSFFQAYHPLIIAFMINLVLPGRVGEIARPAILKKKENIPFTTVLATVLAERIFDLIFMLILFTITFSTIQIDPNLDIPFGEFHLNKATLELIGGSMVKMGLLLIIGIILISADTTRRWIIALVNRIPVILGFLPRLARQWMIDRLCPFLIGIIKNIAMGFALIKEPKQLVACFGLSALIWLLHVLSYYVIGLGCAGIDLSLLEFAAILVIVCFFIALPSAPGYWGLWEAGGVFAMALFGVPASEALGYTLISHIIQVAPVIIAGMISAAIMGINITKITTQP